MSTNRKPETADEQPDDFAFGDGGFAKLYGDRLADSSLLECAVATRWLFVYMLARADAEGRFRCATVKGLARAAVVTLREAEKAVRELEAPDPHSTTPDEAGRRIVRIPGGWKIVTKAKYRDFRTQRQIDGARRQRERRERLEAEVATLRKVARTAGEPPGAASGCDMSRDVTVTCAPEARGQSTYNNNGSRKPSASLPSSSSVSTEARNGTKRRNATAGDIEAGAVRMVEVFNAVFGRETTATPDLIQTFGRRVAAGHRVSDLVTLPLLAEAQGFNSPDVRRRIQPSWLLRDGTGRYTGNDGATRNTHPWLTAILEKADATTIPPNLVPLAERFGLTETLRQLKVKHKRVQPEAAESGPVFSAPRGATA